MIVLSVTETPTEAEVEPLLRRPVTARAPAIARICELLVAVSVTLPPVATTPNGALLLTM